MKTVKSTKIFPINAGMQFTYPGTKGKIKKIGEYKIEFTHTLDNALIRERVISRIIF